MSKVTHIYFGGATGFTITHSCVQLPSVVNEAQDPIIRRRKKKRHKNRPPLFSERRKNVFLPSIVDLLLSHVFRPLLKHINDDTNTREKRHAKTTVSVRQQKKFKKHR